MKNGWLEYVIMSEDFLCLVGTIIKKCSQVVNLYIHFLCVCVWGGGVFNLVILLNENSNRTVQFFCINDDEKKKIVWDETDTGNLCY